MFFNKKDAFTLAEVLITMGIIGVIAALTIPTLVTNYQRNVWSTKLKKVYSISTNACERMLENENVDTIDETELYSALESPNEDTLEKIYKKYFKITNIHDSQIQLPDNALITVAREGNGFSFNVDVNGAKKLPNTSGKDIFLFSLDKDCDLDRDTSDTCFNNTLDNNWKIPENCSNQ